MVGAAEVGRLVLVSAIRPFSFLRGLSSGALAVALFTTSVPARARISAPAQHEALVEEAERLVADGSAAEGAERLAAAYRVMPSELRVTQSGKQVVAMACNAYEAAWQATADPAQLEANQTLLREHFADLEVARAADRPTAAPDEQEQALHERSEGIEHMLAELRTPAATSAEASAPRPVIAPVEPQLELTFPPPDPRLRRNALIIVSAGAAGTVAGGIMVIVGAMTASRAEERRRSSAVEDAGEARSSKVAGTILATTGAIVFSGSVMLLGVGSNRLGDLRREVALTLHPTLGGVALRGRF